MNTGIACPFCGEELVLLSTHSDDKYMCAPCDLRFSQRMLDKICEHAASLRSKIAELRTWLQETRDSVSRLRYPDTTGG